MSKPRYQLIAILLLLVAAAASAAQAPFDPHPLMAKAGPAQTAPYTFAVFGDSYANAELPPLLKMVDAKEPTFVVTVGDMVSYGTDPRAWDRLRDRGGPFMRKYPTWPVIGNHELGSRRAGAKAFESFYGLPSGNYTFVFRRSKFIVLGHGGATPEDQIAFLRKELEDRKDYEHVFVFRHNPFYTVGDKNPGEVPNHPTEETELFTRARVTAVFCGHDHSYYRTLRDGTTYIIAGHAGAGLYPLRRLDEGLPGDAYMGINHDDTAYILHVPGQADRRVRRSRSQLHDWVFAVFVRVNGAKVTVETIGESGEVWDRFEL